MTVSTSSTTSTSTRLPVIVIDTREQRPYSFEGLATVSKALPAGDYSIAGAESQFAIERKSLDDFVNTVIHNADRFANELRALATYDRAAIVVEASWDDVTAHRYTSKARPESVKTIAQALMVGYDIPVYFMGDRIAAREFVQGLCTAYARRMERKAEKLP